MVYECVKCGCVMETKEERTECMMCPGKVKEID